VSRRRRSSVLLLRPHFFANRITGPGETWGGMKWRPRRRLIGWFLANTGASTYCLPMAQSYRRVSKSPAARLPQLLVAMGCSLTAFTGVWLWWFGEDVAPRVGSVNRLTDPHTVHLWMGRLHWIGGYVVSTVIVFMILRAVARRAPWQLLFLALFLGLLGVGIWAGYTADWESARLWASTVGTKMTAGMNFGDRPGLPADLRRARVHLSIVPASMLVVALVSFRHYRRS